MKKIIVALVTAGVIAGVAAPAEAHAASWKRCSGMTSMSSVYGAAVIQHSYQGYKMNCASVRYAARQVGRKVARKYSPNWNVNVFDGYVTWHCSQYTAGYRKTASCYENTSETAFQMSVSSYYD